MKRAAESTAMPYPELPTPGMQSAVVFWLSAWMRHTRELEELNQLINELQTQGRLQHNQPLRWALYGGRMASMDDIARDLPGLINDGGLLFAWHGTTALQLLQQVEPEAVPA